MRLATTTGDLDRYFATHAETVRAFAGSGFRHIDLNLYNDAVPGALLTRGDWMEDIRACAREAEALGFDFVQAHAPALNTMAAGFDMAWGQIIMERAVEACACLGIPCVVFHTGYRPDVTYPDGRERYYQENFAFLRRLFPALERTGVKLLIENTCARNMGSQYFPITGGDMRDFVERLGHPNVGCCWDTGHANIQGLDQYHDILAMGDALCALHVQDNHGVTDDHVMPFAGTMDMDAIMRGLLDVGYEGCFTFESTNLFIPFDVWPNYRRAMFGAEEARLREVPVELMRRAQGLLYEVGKWTLESYGVRVE